MRQKIKTAHTRARALFKKNKTHTLTFASVILAGLLLAGAYTATTQHSFVEVAYTSLSPLGESAGEIIPASCPSDLHDAPVNYGQACSACNACGTCAGGTYNCSAACSAAAPAMPPTYGNACTSAANACGQTANGTINCSSVCSAGTPANPAGYGNACASAANSCGQTGAGTIQCNGSCSGVTPANPATYGNPCESGANSCGMKNTGTINCAGACGASTPSEASCVTCGNNICEATETAGSCPADCSSVGTPLTGWGWSDNIGWISLNCANAGANTCATRSYALYKNGGTGAGTITGYAWSENIGWVSANPSDLAGCPSGSCSVSVSSGGVVSGWLKAIGAQNGWDGWINLTGSNHTTRYATNTFTGWAWGDTVAGWILWSADQPCAATAGDYCDGNIWKNRTAACAITTIIDCAPSTCSTVTNSCVVIPPPTSLVTTSIINASPRLVIPGATSTITWNVKNATSCTVTGNGNSWTGVSGSYTSNPINGTVKYTLNCVGLGGSLTGSVTIKWAPKWQEK
ncbi:MAG: hypothetical protein WAX38_01635 [Minisyncoccia bacterium]